MVYLFRHRSTLRPSLLAAAALLTAAALTAPASAMHGQPGKQLPFKIIFTGGATPTFAPNFPRGGQSTFNSRCSVPSDWLQSWSGSGHASHLGAVTASGSDCERVTDAATGEVVFDDGEFELTAANGDTVHGTYTSGHGNFKTGLYSYDWTFDSGTGRFASFSGHVSDILQITNTTVPPPYPFVDTGHGVISYDATEGLH